MGVFLVFPFYLYRPRLDDRSVTTGHVSLRFGVGTSWLVTTLRIFISFDHYSSPLSRRDYRLQLGDGKLEWSYRRSSCTVPLRPEKKHDLSSQHLARLHLVHVHASAPFNIQAYFRPPSLIPRLSPMSH